MLKEKLLSIFDVKIPGWLMWFFVGLVFCFWGWNGYWRIEEYKEHKRQIELRNTLIRDRIEKMNCVTAKNGNWICEDVRMECFFDEKNISCEARLNDGQKVNAKF